MGATDVDVVGGVLVDVVVELVIAVEVGVMGTGGCVELAIEEEKGSGIVGNTNGGAVLGAKAIAGAVTPLPLLVVVVVPD